MFYVRWPMMVVNRLSRIASFLLLLLAAAAALGQTDDAAAWKGVEDALGRHGNPQPAGVYKFGFPRADLHVTVEGVVLKPALALGSWVAFKRVGDSAVVM